MGLVIAMPNVGSCIPVSLLPGGGGEGGGPITISKPVGQGGLARNVPDDVKTIQSALNQVTVKGFSGGPMPFLVVDGIKGPKTQVAINNFQREQVRSITPDGLVERGGKTILRLNEIVAPISKADLDARL